MNQREDPPKALTGTALPIDRLTFYRQADASILGEIRHGILFVMAFWSLTAARGFAALTDALARLDPEGRLQLVVVDIDGLPDDPAGPELFGRLGGNGEAAFLHDGQVVDTSLGFRPEGFEAKVQALRDWPNG